MYKNDSFVPDTLKNSLVGLKDQLREVNCVTVILNSETNMFYFLNEKKIRWVHGNRSIRLNPQWYKVPQIGVPIPIVRLVVK